MTNQTNATGHTMKNSSIKSEIWYVVGPLAEEECGTAGGIPASVIRCLTFHDGHESQETICDDLDEDVATQIALGVNSLARIAELEAENSRLRPLAELYPLAWEECQYMRCRGSDWVEAKIAHDKARAERGVGQ
jgi:hypothetical protein